MSKKFCKIEFLIFYYNSSSKLVKSCTFVSFDINTSVSADKRRDKNLRPKNEKLAKKIITSGFSNSKMFFGKCVPTQKTDVLLFQTTKISETCVE